MKAASVEKAELLIDIVRYLYLIICRSGNAPSFTMAEFIKTATRRTHSFITGQKEGTFPCLCIQSFIPELDRVTVAEFYASGPRCKETSKDKCKSR